MQLNDAEQLLLKQGSKQDDIWGGGLNIKTKIIYTNAMVNIRRIDNPQQDIISVEVREKFIEIVKKYLRNYV